MRISLVPLPLYLCASVKSDTLCFSFSPRITGACSASDTHGCSPRRYAELSTSYPCTWAHTTTVR